MTSLWYLIVPQVDRENLTSNWTERQLEYNERTPNLWQFGLKYINWIWLCRITGQTQTKRHSTKWLAYHLQSVKVTEDQENWGTAPDWETLERCSVWHSGSILCFKGMGSLGQGVYRSSLYSCCFCKIGNSFEITFKNWSTTDVQYYASFGVRYSDSTIRNVRKCSPHKCSCIRWPYKVITLLW